MLRRVFQQSHGFELYTVVFIDDFNPYLPVIRERQNGGRDFIGAFFLHGNAYLGRQPFLNGMARIGNGDFDGKGTGV